MKPDHRGFIALISAVIISAVILVIAVTGGLTGFFGRSNVLDSEFKNTSAVIAEACADQALLQLANNIAFYDMIGATTTISGNDCWVGQASLAGGGTQRTFRVRSYFKNFYTTFALKVNNADLSVVSWEEVPSFY